MKTNRRLAPEEHSKHFKIISRKNAVMARKMLQNQKLWHEYAESRIVGPNPLHVDIELTNACDHETPHRIHDHGNIPYDHTPVRQSECAYGKTESLGRVAVT